MGPIYLSEMCRPSSSEAGRRHLRSANRGQLVVSRYRLTTAGRRAFSCAGPSAWNSLPEYLTVDTLTLDYFKRSLKCFLFARYAPPGPTEGVKALPRPLSRNKGPTSKGEEYKGGERREKGGEGKGGGKGGKGLVPPHYFARRAPDVESNKMWQ